MILICVVFSAFVLSCVFDHRDDEETSAKFLNLASESHWTKTLWTKTFLVSTEEPGVEKLVKQGHTLDSYREELDGKVGRAIKNARKRLCVERLQGDGHKIDINIDEVTGE
jgi:hypothetical protein